MSEQQTSVNSDVKDDVLVECTPQLLCRSTKTTRMSGVWWDAMSSGLLSSVQAEVTVV